MKISNVFAIAVIAFTGGSCLPSGHHHSHGVGAAAPSQTAAGAPGTIARKSRTHGQGGRGGRGRGRGGSQTSASGSAPAAPPSSSNNGNGNNSGSRGGKGGGNVIANLVPDFGIQAGVDPQNGNCQGLNNVKIPCDCPPDRNAFIAKMQEFVSAGNAEGTPVSFPDDDSLDSQITRLTTSIVTLQNFNGRPGSGCPASSTTFVSQRAALQARL